jgi:hypothetical protein
MTAESERAYLTLLSAHRFAINAPHFLRLRFSNFKFRSLPIARQLGVIGLGSGNVIDTFDAAIGWFAK